MRTFLRGFWQGSFHGTIFASLVLLAYIVKRGASDMSPIIWCLAAAGPIGIAVSAWQAYRRISHTYGRDS